jgi:DNA-binding CsgD family transcriptional regulator
MPQGRSPAHDWPFVGRVDEVDAIRQRWDDAVRGVLLTGEAGRGKSRLAEAIAEAEIAGGRPCVRVVATEGGRGIPFGALAPFLPRSLATIGGDEIDRLAVLRAAQSAFDDLATEVPVLVVVDDVDRLDPLSAAVLRQLAEGGTVLILATLRTGQRAPDDIDQLRSRGAVVEWEVRPLDRETVGRVVERAVDGPVDPATLATLANTSRGNLLYLRELVTGALARDELRRDPVDRAWRLAQPFTGSPRLHDLIEGRLDGLDRAGRRAMEMLALAGELPLQVLEDLAGADGVEQLDGAELIEVRTDRRRAVVTAAHPLYAEIVRSSIPIVVGRRLHGELADQLEGYGARRREDPVRLAAWRLASGQGASPDLLARAAQLSVAFYDAAGAVPLARAALDAGAGPSVALLLAEAQSVLGHYEDVEETLAAVDAEDLEPEAVAQLIARRSSNLVHGLGRLADGLALYDDPAASSRSELLSKRLAAKRVGLLAVGGEVGEALAVADGLVESDDLEVRVQAGYARALALMHGARFEEARDAAGWVYEQHQALEGRPGHGHPVSQLPTALECLVMLGQVDDAERYAHAIRDGAALDGSAVGLALADELLGQIALFRGDLEQARAAFERGLLSAHDMAGSWRDVSLRCGRGLAAVWSGAVEQAADEWSVVDGRDVAVRAVAADRERLHAWLMAEGGDRSGARDHLIRAAADLDDQGNRYRAAVLVHDAACLGDRRDSTVARLDELASASDSPVIKAWSAWVRADRSGDGDRASAVIDELERVGQIRVAAEAARALADTVKRGGDPRRARELLRRHAALRARCPGVPAVEVDDEEAVVPLTEREREIATLAAGRLSNREIAERLVVSVRTVENHLARVYAKLGITGRRDLAGALDRDS